MHCLQAGLRADPLNTPQCREVVTAFLRREGRILLLRRSDEVGSYRGRWAAVSGYLEDPTPLDQALREIHEETGLGRQQVHLVASAPVRTIEAPELDTTWLIHPFLFEVVASAPIRLNWENDESAWTPADELGHYETVPQLVETLQDCLEHEKRSATSAD